MKQITVISGKGGTGKTSVLASLAYLARGDAVVADCDVDAPDLHLILKPKIEETRDFVGLQTAVIDELKCTQCGACQDNCRFDAIRNFQVNFRHCEGCKVCALVCPADAVEMVDQISGHAYVSSTKFGTLVHAELIPGQEASGKLVTMVRELAQEVAERENKDLILIDGSPGVGCPVIASITGVDLALIMTEPTLSGIHDLERVIKVAHHFGVAALVCINKYDLNLEVAQQIEKICKEMGAEVVGKLPFDPSVVKAMVAEEAVAERAGPVGDALKSLWDELKSHL